MIKPPPNFLVVRVWLEGWPSYPLRGRWREDHWEVQFKEGPEWWTRFPHAVTDWGYLAVVVEKVTHDQLMSRLP